MSSLLNVSESVFLALHGMVVIAKAAPEKVRVKELALELKASEAHLAKVFQRLHKNALVRSTRGPTGGYSLNDPPAEISLLDIYEAVEAKVNTDICPFGKLDCMYESCVFESSIDTLAQNIYTTFANLKLADYL